LLASIIIVLVAVLLFIPSTLMSKSLTAQVEKESLGMGRKISSALRNPVAADLPDQMNKQAAVYSNDANQITALALQTTQRELLSYEIFPKAPNDASTLLFLEFAQNYQSGIDKMFEQLRARECPSTAELEQGLETLSTGPQRGLGMSMGMGMGMTAQRTPRRTTMMDLGLSVRGMTDASFTIVEGICEGRAKEAGLYGSPPDIAGYSYWGEYKYDVKSEESVKHCWYYQLAYWVIEDVMKTIGAANEGHASLLDAPVKRLTQLTFTMGLKKASKVGKKGGVAIIRGGSARRRKKDVESDRPIYVTAPEEQLTESCTGRVSDENIDVIHFNFTVIVEAKSVLSFMKELCNAKEHTFKGWEGDQPAQTFKHNQITILESSMSSIDTEGRDHARYRYGREKVVELDLICEYVFNRHAYDEKKPEVIKNPPLEE
jgi:hypothetical protein